MQTAPTTPAPAATDEQLGGCYVNDIVATYPHRTGYGSLVLHAALKFGQYEPEDPVVLEAFLGSSVNEWYGRLGLLPKPHIPTDDFCFDEDQALPMMYYGTSSYGNLDTVVTALETAHPHLMTATETS